MRGEKIFIFIFTHQNESIVHSFEPKKKIALWCCAICNSKGEICFCGISNENERRSIYLLLLLFMHTVEYKYSNKHTRR